MGTSNFAYENRCVVVTNDDYEFGNLPKLGNWVNSNRNYPSRILEEYDFFKFYQIVLTSGYYEDACIDFVEKNDVGDIEDWLGYCLYNLNKKDFIKECCDEFGLTKYRINKLCGTIKDCGGDLDCWLSNAVEKITEYLKEIEANECNKVIDQIKKDYGYEEICCIGRFSNGECVYERVG